MSFLFSPSGRFSRWQWRVVWLPETALIFFGYIAYLTLQEVGPVNDFIAALFGVGFVVLLWASIAASVKRFHDLNLAGWWALILLLPISGLGTPVLPLLAFIAVMGWCGLWPGTGTPNVYGAPRG